MTYVKELFNKVRTKTGENSYGVDGAPARFETGTAQMHVRRISDEAICKAIKICAEHIQVIITWYDY